MRYQNFWLLIGFLACWQLSVIVFAFPPFILPSPVIVLQALGQNMTLLAQHTFTTFLEIIGGLLLGVAIGFILAIAMVLSRPIKNILQPIIHISQSIPTFAIAPILIFWLGYTLLAKLIMTALMIFFPIASNLFDGLENTPKVWLDLAKIMNATRWQTLWKIRLPAAAPNFRSGLNIACAIAPMGAVIGEWLGANSGLGFLMLEANAQQQIPLVFASLIMLVILSFTITKIVKLYTQHTWKYTMYTQLTWKC